MGIIPFDQAPDYLPTGVKNTGLEGLTKDDYKTPRILLLQALSPQIKTFPGVALPGHFWHTGMNVSLGDSFSFVPAIAAKRVIVWRPRDDNNGGILAFSRDGYTWQTGGNQEFRVKLRGIKEPIIWKTGKDVASSGLTEFGSANPNDPDAPPAATVSYEYLCYLPNTPELSPCVMAVSKTGLPNGKMFNTSLAMIAKTGKPIYCVNVTCFADEKHGDGNEWTVPTFKLMGYVPKPVYEAAKQLSEQYGDYNIEYSQDEAGPTIDDEIKY